MTKLQSSTNVTDLTDFIEESDNKIEAGLILATAAFRTATRKYLAQSANDEPCLRTVSTLSIRCQIDLIEQMNERMNNVVAYELKRLTNSGTH